MFVFVRTSGIVADSSYCMVTTGMLTSSLPDKMPWCSHHQDTHLRHGSYQDWIKIATTECTWWYIKSKSLSIMRLGQRKSRKISLIVIHLCPVSWARVIPSIKPLSWPTLAEFGKLHIPRVLARPVEILAFYIVFQK